MSAGTHETASGNLHGGPLFVCTMPECLPREVTDVILMVGDMNRELVKLRAENEALRSAPFACDTHACGHCKGCRAAGIQDLFTEYSATLSRVRTLARSWAEQPTDYDEDTERQIADGTEILALLDGREA